VKYYISAQDTIAQATTYPAAAPAEYRLHGRLQSLPALYVNEILASNAAGIVDEHRPARDWLEIRNRDTVPIDLGGMFLSDNLDRPQVGRSRRRP
jgi:hypothetical protein